MRRISATPGSNTLRAASKGTGFSMPNMGGLGLFHIVGADPGPTRADFTGCVARLAERSRGKDTTTGHWEIAGLISEQAMPTFPEGFPKELLDRLSAETGRGILCNRPYSGTDVIRDFGEKHERTGALIVYTSADSVLQIAAHEDIVPVEQLYEYCRIARKICQGPWGVGRIIARPFIGTPGNYTRTTRRHDFSLNPPEPTMLDIISGAGKDVLGRRKDLQISLPEAASRIMSILQATQKALTARWNIWIATSMESALPTW